MEPVYRMLPADTRRPSDPFASWLGRVRASRAGESWPTGREGPLPPLCQVNVVELPERPALLRDVALVAVFGRGDEGEVRAYPSLAVLVPCSELERAAKPRPLRFERTDDPDAEGDRLGGSGREGFVLRVAGFTVTRQGEEWRLAAGGC